MAENKKSFVLYADQEGLFDKLTDVKAGKLIKIIFQYVNDRNPKIDDTLLSIAFEPIKMQLKRDLKDWEAKRSKRSESGKMGGLKSGESRRSRSKRSNPSECEANEAVNVNGNANVNVNVRENTGHPAFDISKSNLGRQPIIPTKNQVWEAISGAGGTREMAKSFFEKHEGTGWFINGSPIVNYTVLAQRFVTNWKDNENKKKPVDQAPATILKTIG